jgi:hypothetical protein
MQAWVYGYLAGFAGLIGAAVGAGVLIGKGIARLVRFLI